MISRGLGESSVQVSLPSDYLDSTFAAYGLKEKVGSNSPPDLGSYVEKTDGTRNPTLSGALPKVPVCIRLR